MMFLIDKTCSCLINYKQELCFFKIKNKKIYKQELCQRQFKKRES